MELHRTTYIGQVMAYELDEEPDHDLATRTGSFAMLIYSLGRTEHLATSMLSSDAFHVQSLLPREHCFLT